MRGLSHFPYRFFIAITIVVLAFVAFPGSTAGAASIVAQDNPGCPSGSLVCLPFLEIIWGSPASDSANGNFSMRVDAPGDGTVTVFISQLQIRATYAPSQVTPPNAPPSAPSSIDQYRTDALTAIPQGGLTNEPLVVFEATASDPQSDQYKLDVEVVSAGGPFANTATCSSPLVDSGSLASTGPCGPLGDGAAYQWQYRLVDSAGASTEWTAFGGSDPDFSVDTTPPTVSITGTPPVLTGPSALFEFAGTDASGVATFLCQLDAGGFAACASPAAFDSLLDGSHTFEVQAVDNAGNIGSPASMTWTVDATAPTATITASPTDPSNVATPTFEFTGDDGVGSGVAGFQCQVDAGGFAPCASGDSFGPLGDGPHTFDVQAIDNAGNVGTAATGTWTIDATAPVATITAWPIDPSSDSSATFEFIGDDGADGTGIAGFQCQIDDGGFAFCSSGDTFGPLADGSHTFAVQAIDVAANVGAPASYSWVISTVAPLAVNIETGPSDLTNSTSADFTFSTIGSPTAIECDLDGIGFVPCDGPTAQTYAGPLPDSPHTFTVRATDAAANTRTDAWTWTVDATAPTVTLNTVPASPSAAASTVFDFTGDDGAGSGVKGFQCQVDGGGFAACSAGDSFGPLSDGSHTFEVQAVDQAGNTSTTASVSWTIDTTPPIAAIIGTPPSLTGPSAQFEFTVSDAGAVAATECQVDGSGFVACISPKSLLALADGSHRFEVRGRDTAGNVGAPASFTWTVDATAPTVTITEQPPASSDDTTPTFVFSGDDAGGSGIASFECSIDADPFAACVSPATFGPLSDGPHTFSVRALDVVGNTGLSAVYAWTISAVPAGP